jgi:galactokinase
VYESTRTELEKHEDELTRLSDLLKNGAIDWNVYAKAVKKVNAEFNKMEKFTPGAVGAKVIQFGSIAGNPGLSTSSVDTKIEKNTKDALKLQERTAKATEKIAAQSKGVGVIVLGAEALQ